MKKFKKLIPALCMLLVSSVMLGTTTFAWFSMNRTVTATGMAIKAEVSTQLLIKGSADSAAYKSAINFTSTTDSAVNSNNKLDSVPATAYKGRNETASAALIKEAGGWKKLKKLIAFRMTVQLPAAHKIRIGIIILQYLKPLLPEPTTLKMISH